MAWKPDELLRELSDHFQDRALRIETRLTHVLGRDARVPPLKNAREIADLQGIEPEDLAEISHGASRSVHDDGGGDRRPLASILPVDVLNDFLAPLVLEIDVDVGRFVALLGDEALHQERAALEPHGRDAEAIADERVRGRAAALT